MNRRSFAYRVCGILVALPTCAHAQSNDKVYRIGLIEAIPARANAANLEALRKGMRELGYVEGRNLIIEYRSAEGHAERFPELASELVRARVDVIVARGTPATLAARNATSTIPVVMATMGDPRLNVASYANPGGNTTGLTTFSTELTAKRVQLLKELVPQISRIAMLHNMSNPAVPAEWEETKRAAQTLKIRAELLDVRNVDDLRRAFETASAHSVDAMVVGADGFIQAHVHDIVRDVEQRRLPTVYPSREFAEAGGLIAYGVNYPQLYYGFARYIDNILKGSSPGQLAVAQPTRFELVVNMKAARQLGIEVAPSVLLRADQVIR